MQRKGGWWGGERLRRRRRRCQSPSKQIFRPLSESAVQGWCERASWTKRSASARLGAPVGRSRNLRFMECQLQLSRNNPELATWEPAVLSSRDCASSPRFRPSKKTEEVEKISKGVVYGMKKQKEKKLVGAGVMRWRNGRTTQNADIDKPMTARALRGVGVAARRGSVCRRGEACGMDAMEEGAAMDETSGLKHVN